MAQISANFELLAEEVQAYGYEYIEPLKIEKQVGYHHISSDKDYMAKVFSKSDLFRYPQLKKVMNREYTIADLVKKNFNYLLCFNDFFYTKSYAVFVYEYCQSGTLRDLMDALETQMTNETEDRIKTMRSQDNVKKIIMKDIYQGLEELRFLGVLHKNLSPELIYVSKFGLKIGGYEFCEENNHKQMSP